MAILFAPTCSAPPVPDSDTALMLLAPLAAQETEVAAFACLDKWGRLIGTLAARGARDCVRLPLRQIVADALRLETRAVIMAHNHPSGRCRPSRGDIAATRTVVQALRAVEIEVLDHLVLARDGVASFRALGLL